MSINNKEKRRLKKKKKNRKYNSFNLDNDFSFNEFGKAEDDFYSAFNNEKNIEERKFSLMYEYTKKDEQRLLFTNVLLKFSEYVSEGDIRQLDNNLYPILENFMYSNKKIKDIDEFKLKMEQFLRKGDFKCSDIIEEVEFCDETEEPLENINSLRDKALGIEYYMDSININVLPVSCKL